MKKSLTPYWLAALALIATGCSTDKSLQSRLPIGQEICASFLGAENVNAVRRTMGGGEIRYADTNMPMGKLTNSLTSMARNWRPGDDYYSSGSIPCVFGPAATNETLTVRVGWSSGSLPTVRALGWKNAGGDVVSGWWLDEYDSRYLFPCKVRGSHIQQQEETPLSVRLKAKNLDHFDAALRSKVASALARTMSAQLHCANKPHIPDRLTTPRYTPSWSHSSPNPTNSPRYSTRPAQASGQAAAPR
jgi:hypothetical protein